ncbi:MAG: hypothetical protein ABL921_35085, partial [Pirellula sp.]
MIESRRQAIQAEIDTRKSAAERNRLGQFATPNALAVEIARYVKSVLGRTKGSIRFADPSIGSGSFFSAALEVFGSKQISSAVGIELDPAFADAARDQHDTEAASRSSASGRGSEHLGRVGDDDG